MPAGHGNTPHLEITWELARRFIRPYGTVFAAPRLIPADVPPLRGSDGRATMSKSAGNAISLADPPDEVRRKVAAGVHRSGSGANGSAPRN